MDISSYRSQAEQFLTEIDREFYEHFAGLKDEFAIEEIYEKHAGLFTREAAEHLRDQGTRELAKFAAEGYIEQAVKQHSAELARLEATLEVEVDGERHGFRESSVIQANEQDADRRRAIDAARNQVTAEHMNPVLVEMFEQSRSLVQELGWPSVLAMTEELSGIDLRALGRQTEAFIDASEANFEASVEPRLRAELGLGFDELERADLAAFFRAPSLDEWFPADDLLPTLAATVEGLGLDRDSPGKVIVDAEARPNKSPRAFCSPVRVPDEVYLVIARIGGRDDYEALMHEAGHAQHYSNVDRSLPFEHRYLGDNSVTEGFAFLLQHLTEDPLWLERRLRVSDAATISEQARASKIVYLRRYSAKLGYELELHAESPPDRPDELYARRLSEAVHVDWPRETWLADVDAFFYAAAYLRAWALETHLRAVLRERFGELWFEEREAGVLLRELWSQGQRLPAHELLGELTGAELDFSAIEDDVLAA